MESSTNPNLVSVIIPCYKQGQYLGEAIESVLNQTYAPVEIIVVNDGSPDETAEVADRYCSVRCIWQMNQGLSAARNTGLRQSNGVFLVFLDADDRLRPTALETGVRLLQKHPECAIVVGRCQHVSTDGTPLDSYNPRCSDLNDPYSALLRTNFILNPASVMYRRAVFGPISPFDPSVNAAADYDLYLRIARRYPILCHDDVVVEYRQHSTNMTSNTPLMFKTLLAVLDSQRGYVRANSQYKKVYKRRIQTLRCSMGGILTEEVITQIRSATLSKRFVYNFLMLLRLYPRGIAVIAARAYLKIGTEVYRKCFPVS